MTTRGFGTEETREVGRIIAEVLTWKDHRRAPRRASWALSRTELGSSAVSVPGQSERMSFRLSGLGSSRGVAMRPSWESYFMEIARVVATRSTCLRRQVGAVLVNNRQILATGYNGAPRGLVHCLDRGCMRDDLCIPSGERHELCRGLHAEQNAIIQAAYHGTRIQGAEMYCTHQPCVRVRQDAGERGHRDAVLRRGLSGRTGAGGASEAGTRLVRVAGGRPFLAPKRLTAGRSGTDTCLHSFRRLFIMRPASR